MKPLIAVVVLLWCFTALAEPRNIRLSWTTPDTAHTATLAWNEDSPEAPNILQYGYVAPGQFEIEAESAPAPGDMGTVFVARLTELKADTEYQYRIGEPGNWSQVRTFVTAPENPCTPFRFGALGDNRPDADWLPQLKWNPILSETSGAAPAFLLHTGDIVKDGKLVNQWQDFLDNSDPVMAKIPMMFTLGNHDDGPQEGDGANYNRIFALPINDATGTEDFYYFVYGNAIFVSLSSQTFGGGAVPFETQAQWLDAVLEEHPVKWKFVYLHHPPFASHEKFDLIFTEFEFNHPPDEKGFNATLIPIFDKHHVDIVFAGHNHYYERLGPLTAGPDPATGALAGAFDQGTVYVITGGAGALVYDEFQIPWVDIEIDLIKWVCGKGLGSKVCAGDHHFVTIDIDDGHLHFEARATAQQTVGYDQDNQALIDAFDIYKDDDPLCLEPLPVDDPVVAEPMPDVVVAVDAEVMETPEWQADVPTLPETLAEVALPEVTGGKELSHPEPGIDAPADAFVASPEPPEGPPSGCGCRVGCATLPSGIAPVLLLLLLCLLSIRRRYP